MECRRGRASGNFAAPLVGGPAALEAAAPAPAARRGQSVRPPRHNGEAPSKSCPAGRGEAASPSLVGGKGKGSAQVGGKEAAPSGRKSSQSKKGEGGAPKGGPPRREQRVAPALKEAEDACRELEAPRAKAAPPPPPAVRRKTGPDSRRTTALPREEEEEEEEEERGRRGEAAGCGGRRRSGPRGLQDESGAEGRPRAKAAEPREEAPPVEPVLRKVLERLRLAKREVSVASAQVNELEKMLMEAVKELCGRRVVPLGTGSYYERVKVCRPDEFDIMLTIPDLRVEPELCNCEASSGAFYYVKLPNLSEKDKLRKFLNADQQLSPTMLLSDLRRIIGDKVKKMEGWLPISTYFTDVILDIFNMERSLEFSAVSLGKEELGTCVKLEVDCLGCFCVLFAGGKICVQKTKPTSPAITILLKAHPADISIDFTVALELRLRPKLPKDGLAIGEWLGTKTKREFGYKPSYVVPKTLKDGKLLRDTWRLSFSHIEKLMINNHGHAKTCCEASGEKCCRKNCLKLLKYLLEQLKEKHKQRNQFNKFFSYHAKTAFFHACSIWPRDADWKKEDLAVCFDRFLNFFLDCLRKTELNHFFLPDFNFFSAIRIDSGKCAILARVIEQERNSGFPIFKEN